MADTTEVILQKHEEEIKTLESRMDRMQELISKNFEQHSEQMETLGAQISQLNQKLQTNRDKIAQKIWETLEAIPRSEMEKSTQTEVPVLNPNSTASTVLSDHTQPLPVVSLTEPAVETLVVTAPSPAVAMQSYSTPFSGNDPYGFIQGYEEFFKVNPMTEVDMIQYVMQDFEREALEWYFEYVEENFLDTWTPDCWEDFVAAIYRKFQDLKVEHHLLKIQQGGDSFVFETGDHKDIVDHEDGDREGSQPTISEPAHPVYIQLNYDKVKLAKRLISSSFANRVFFSYSGTEVNKAAIKSTWKFQRFSHSDRKPPPTDFIFFSNCLNGGTIGALALTSKKHYRSPFKPVMFGVTFLEHGDIQATTELIKSGNIAAEFVEYIQGESGISSATNELLLSLHNACEGAETLLVFYEVQCGLGRTGYPWAHEDYGVFPGIMTLAKPLVRGLTIGTVLLTERVAAAYHAALSMVEKDVPEMELDFDLQDSLLMGVSNLSISDDVSNGAGNLGLTKGRRTVAGEHPTSTLFVRNINSNVEDFELRFLFEQYRDMKGILIDDPLDVLEENPQRRRAPPLVRVEKMFEAIQPKLSGALQFLLCLLLERKNSNLYDPWKRKNLSAYGIVTQCIAPAIVNDQYLTNVSLKTKAKFGGLNSYLAVEYLPSIPWVSKAPTVILGMDVSHDSPRQSDVPSIVVVVSFQQWPLISRYKASVRNQLPMVEEIDSLFKKVSDTKDNGIMREFFVDFYVSSGLRKPDQIIIFRDGISESQFNQSLNIELDQTIEACKFLDKKWCPRFVLIIAQKIHHTNFFQPRHSDNVFPGTVIDKNNCHQRNNAFYLCAQAGMLDTARPTHYQVLLNEVGFSIDDLPDLVHSLSYVYQRGTTAISVVAPIFYGDGNLVFIANNWHTALLIIYLKAYYRDTSAFSFSFGWYFAFVQGFVYLVLLYLQGLTTRQMVNPWKTYVKLSAVLMGSHRLTKWSLAFLNYLVHIMFKSTKEVIFTMNLETTLMEMLLCSTVAGLPFLILPMILTGDKSTMLSKLWKKSKLNLEYDTTPLVFDPGGFETQLYMLISNNEARIKKLSNVIGSQEVNLEDKVF